MESFFILCCPFLNDVTQINKYQIRVTYCPNTERRRSAWRRTPSPLPPQVSTPRSTPLLRWTGPSRSPESKPAPSWTPPLTSPGAQRNIRTRVLEKHVQLNKLLKITARCWTCSFNWTPIRIHHKSCCLHRFWIHLEQGCRLKSLIAPLP